MEEDFEDLGYDEAPLSGSPVSVPLLNPETVSLLNPKAICSSDPEPISAGKPEAMPLLNPKEISFINPEMIGSLNPDPISTRKPEAMPLVNPKAIFFLNPVAISSLDPEPISAREPEAIPLLNPKAISFIDPAPGSFPKTKSMSLLNPQKMPSLNSEPPSEGKALIPTSEHRTSYRRHSADSRDAYRHNPKLSMSGLSSISPLLIGERRRGSKGSPVYVGKKGIRWLGVNCDDHDTTKEPVAKHFPKSGPPFTPHIIVSPEIDETPPDFDDDDIQDGSKDQVQEKQKSPVEAAAASADEDKSPEVVIDNGTGQVSESVFHFPEDVVDAAILEEDETPAQELDSSRSQSSTDEVVAIEEDVQIYENNRQDKKDSLMPNYRATGDSSKYIQVVRNDNASPLSPSNLDPFEYMQRKTRRSSMIDMLRRASSQSIPDTPMFNLQHSASKMSLVTTNMDGQHDSRDTLLLCLSALYGKLIVVMGMAFPIAEIISNDVPLVFYNIFYLFLYFGSIFFLIYAYLFLLRTKALPVKNIKKRMQNFQSSMNNLDVKLPDIPFPDTFRHMFTKKKGNKEKSDSEDGVSEVNSVYRPPRYTLTESSNHGSMYLKMGAVVFGVGSMIYSGLEFGQFFELLPDAECGNVVMAITPIARMIFTFLQMYFIFLNSRVAISRHITIARFGLMHMLATNLCIWQSVLVQETKHEIAHLVHYAAQKNAASHHEILDDHFPGVHEVTTTASPLDSLPHNIAIRSTEIDISTTCRRANLMGEVVNSASPFLFPCTIEYSLLCAGVLYVMWKNINALRVEKSTTDVDSDISNFIARKVRHHYSVDCARASRGLFIGIFVLVLTIISLILFYVLISNEEYRAYAIMEANIVEVSIYSMAIFALVMGMKQMSQLEFMQEGDIELDNILLIIAQAGVYIYTSFTIIGGCFTDKESPMLPLITAFLTLAQTTLQTIFILDGSRRCCYTAEQHDRKPGREIVTFLLVCNLAMWAISTFETSRADAHPVQMDFYGIWAWTIISHVSMPLAIFYRFHVTVCLGEIWKRAYKVKQDFFAL